MNRKLIVTAIAALLQVCLASAATDPVWQFNNGLILLDIEDLNYPTAGFKLGTSTAGYMGKGYLECLHDGPPASNAIIKVKFNLPQAGKVTFVMRTKTLTAHDGNDCWIGFSGMTKKDVSSPDALNFTIDGILVFKTTALNSMAGADWGWGSGCMCYGNQLFTYTFPTSGEKTMILGSRSKRFLIDRIALGISPVSLSAMNKSAKFLDAQKTNNTLNTNSGKTLRIYRPASAGPDARFSLNGSSFLAEVCRAIVIDAGNKGNRLMVHR